jgi:EAL domain-containing protein (putative c-di-GMP-specific phosphodiesterase class I)
MTILYQPQRSLKDDRVNGYEALLRWTHPKRGLVPLTSSFPLLKKPARSWRLASGCCGKPVRRRPAGVTD